MGDVTDDLLAEEERLAFQKLETDNVEPWNVMDLFGEITTPLGDPENEDYQVFVEVEVEGQDHSVRLPVSGARWDHIEKKLTLETE